MEELIGEKETEDKAKNFASLIKGFKNSLLINLIGNLGAGKTTFVRGLIQELGFDEFVKSPTFTIVESYESDNLKVFHLDIKLFHFLLVLVLVPLETILSLLRIFPCLLVLFCIFSLSNPLS